MNRPKFDEEHKKSEYNLEVKNVKLVLSAI